MVRTVSLQGHRPPPPPQSAAQRGPNLNDGGGTSSPFTAARHRRKSRPSRLALLKGPGPQERGVNSHPAPSPSPRAAAGQTGQKSRSRKEEKRKKREREKVIINWAGTGTEEQARCTQRRPARRKEGSPRARGTHLGPPPPPGIAREPSVRRTNSRWDGA